MGVYQAYAKVRDPRQAPQNPLPYTVTSVAERAKDSCSRALCAAARFVQQSVLEMPKVWTSALENRWCAGPHLQELNWLRPLGGAAPWAESRCRRAVGCWPWGLLATPLLVAAAAGGAVGGAAVFPLLQPCSHLRLLLLLYVEVCWRCWLGPAAHAAALLPSYPQLAAALGGRRCLQLVQHHHFHCRGPLFHSLNPRPYVSIRTRPYQAKRNSAGLALKYWEELGFLYRQM